MGYEFAGFFALAEPPVLEDALATWPGCRGRIITEPFHGIGVAVPERALTYGEPPDEGRRARELAHLLEERLVDWSLRYPATRFVFVRAECFGGRCQYWGYVCQNGAIQEQASLDGLTRAGDPFPGSPFGPDGQRYTQPGNLKLPIRVCHPLSEDT